MSAPVVMLAKVDPEFAFLSTLPFSSGATSPAPSVSPLDTVPNPTASITAPVSIGPCLKATLLLFAMVPLVALSQAIEAEIALLHQRKKP